MEGLQTSIWNNRLKTWFLVVLFPIFLGVAFFLLFFLLSGDYDVRNEYGNSVRHVEVSTQERFDLALQETEGILIILGPILMIWLLISFLFQRKLMFAFSGAKVVTRKEEPEIYNIVENLCISRGLQTPKIGIIESSGMNAFALGWRASDSWIVFTRGLLDTLDKSEIEAVAGHELTHIINKDSLLMLVMVLYIGAVTLIGEVLIRTGRVRSNGKEKNILPLIGLVLLILGYLFYPLVRLAISRKREYLADAGSVFLTKDNQAMISALKKISVNSAVPVKNDQMASMFISNPLKKMGTLFQTHPSLEDRIKALQHY